MIINNWYVAAAVDEIGDAPCHVRMLGCDFVIFRDPEQRIACLSDVCCHRGGSLSRGKRINGCVQCPYHGWEYAADGRVQRIPSLGDDIKIPARARIDSYPVQERYGLVWVFLGDMPENTRPELPQLLSEFGDENNWRMIRTHRTWAVNWARLKENLADASHLFLVHSFGKHLPEKTDIFPVEETEWGVRIPQIYRVIPDKSSKTAVNAPQAEERRMHSDILIEISVIGMIQKNTQLMSSGYDQVIWNALTPIDGTNTRHYTLHFRNFQKEPEHDEAIKKTLIWGFDEDAAVIDHIRPPLTPARAADELFVETDGPEKAYREKAAKMAGELGLIDWRRLQDQSLDQVLVIPSPARHAGGNWVHESIPLVNPPPVKPPPVKP
jgi:phenylpropionate dioxygenase-like ring-hydroxylating dioxygenase large terminal subunit